MDPVIVVGGARVFSGDCREALKHLPDNSVDSVVTDPPYELGFMGKSWDSSGIAYDPAVWAECLRVLKPGGHILAFGGSRTWHRLAVAVEDAGFELRDSIAWIYGSGFPKSLDVSKAIDKRSGYEGDVIGTETVDVGIQGGSMHAGRSQKLEQREIRELSSEAKAWEGWGTALKPAFEPVVVGRKPFGKGVTVAENVLAWGVGGLNIDGSRVGFRNEADKNTVQGAQWHAVPNDTYGKFQRQHDREVMNGADSTPDKGRWPANVIFDEVTAGLLDEQTGVLTSGKVKPGTLRGIKSNANVAYADAAAGSELSGYGDTGGASRFFYVAKASKRDRNEGLEELEDGDTPYRSHRPNFENTKGIETPFAGAGRSGKNLKNFHPTVKPTALMRYLIKLVTPEGGVVLDPFTGSGSTGKAALLDGFQFVGVELTEEYLPIIEGRLRWASEQVEDDGTLF
jgi:site-specific DNA-methyltransferase (adenine-specific)